MVAEAKKYPVTKEKRKEYNDRYRSKNAEKILANNRLWAANHQESVAATARKYRTENKEKRADTKRRSYLKNKHKWAAYLANRRASKIAAKPKWANDFFMEEAYSLARLRTKMFGFKWNVDHIVPLRSPSVCGLHCEQNFRVISQFENYSKNNRHWPDMP